VGASGARERPSSLDSASSGGICAVDGYAVIESKAQVAVELEDITVCAGEHLVEFYTHQSELADTVGGYLRDAIQTGGAAVVIATEAHRAAFKAQLRDAGISPGQCRRHGALIMLDANTTMASFMRQGGIDRDAFFRVVGSVVRGARETGRPVFAYGEMVALLWEAGHVPAAIELEGLWNELSQELPFALLCAYRSESVLGHEHAEALQQVCHLHSSVLHAPPSTPLHAPDAPGAEVLARFYAESASPRAARRFVKDTLGRWGQPHGLAEDAQLLVTELATNAVIHAGTPYTVTLRPEAPGVRISVRDACPAAPTVCNPGPLDITGRGLLLVAALSADWGVEETPDGKAVWATLHP
jgi:anti-sigma regulatory factor (Ser/Thr protein kinase)